MTTALVILSLLAGLLRLLTFPLYESHNLLPPPHSRRI